MKTVEELREHRKRYYLENKDKWHVYSKSQMEKRGKSYYAATARRYYWRHRDSILASPAKKSYQKAYQEKHKYKLTEYKRAYYFKNKHIIRIKNDEWGNKNPGWKAASHAKRKVRLGKSNTSNARAFYTFIRNKKRVKCYYCGKMIHGTDAHIDHIIALARDGNHSSENLCASCPSCNLAKGTKLPSDFSPKNQMILNL